MWYSTTSPGTTGLRNFALVDGHEIDELRPLDAASLACTQIAPAVCAMPSISMHARHHGLRRESGR